MTTIRELENAAAAEVKERLEYEGWTPGRYFDDCLHEIADSHVPVYNSQLLSLAAEDNALATDEPECGPAFDGRATPVNIIAANVYERLYAAAAEAWQTLEPLCKEYEETKDFFEGMDEENTDEEKAEAKKAMEEALQALKEA